jgi:DNA-binding transcriptional regulator YdaS (Cro superfamily)
MGLNEYIALHFAGSQKAFAAAQGVQPAQVTQWLKKEFIVINDTLYSPRRALSRTAEKP